MFKGGVFYHQICDRQREYLAQFYELLIYVAIGILVYVKVFYGYCSEYGIDIQRKTCILYRLYVFKIYFLNICYIWVILLIVAGIENLRGFIYIIFGYKAL